ncbi:hypothetical protein FACS189490_10300 [Clostridia bacterium]|nr:hypothetical protein FACS189490_10300 [Clostridia bacterium]
MTNEKTLTNEEALKYITDFRPKWKPADITIKRVIFSPTRPDGFLVILFSYGGQDYRYRADVLICAV